FELNHLPIEDQITASELQNMRPLPGQGELETAQGLMQRRMKRQINSLDATVEYGMIGSVKGIIYDADGSTVIYNLFNEFGISQPTEDYALGTAAQVLITKSNSVKNKIEDALGDAPYTKIVAVCGKTWFDKFISHESVREAYMHFESTHNPNREDLRYVGFEHGGITYVQYRGTVNGIAYVPASEAYAFPVGVPELFLQFYGPANYMEYANTEGLPRYAKIGHDPSGYDKYIPWEMQTNPMSICTRPGTLVKLTTSN
ncbi:MAG: major capsid protein, partial [Armatimonadota bacterium]